jgi:hypothetical protein
MIVTPDFIFNHAPYQDVAAARGAEPGCYMIIRERRPSHVKLLIVAKSVYKLCTVL